MTKAAASGQPGLFDQKPDDANIETIVLFGLGEFQSRGFELIGRRLPLDRLRGAFKRAAAELDLPEPADKTIVGALERLGGEVMQLPGFVAKHPFRITIRKALAEMAAERYRQLRDRRGS